jgi:restriction system protein
MTATRYVIDVEHPGLKKYRRIIGPDKFVVEHKAQLQRAIWADQWRAQTEATARKAEREKLLHKMHSLKTLAAERTTDAEQRIGELRVLLVNALDQPKFDIWESLKETGTFSESPPIPPQRDEMDPAPQRDAIKYRTRVGLIDWLLPFLRRKKIAEAEKRFAADLLAWNATTSKIERDYNYATIAFERRAADYNTRKAQHAAGIAAQHSGIEELKQRYSANDPNAVEELSELALGRSTYPDCCPQEVDVSFSGVTGVLLVDYRLPSIADMPPLKEVRYVASRNALDEIPLKASVRNALYDDVVYQICLRSVFELYQADTSAKIRATVFNGWVQFTDPATGQETSSCILSLSAEREKFLSINLANVEPKACFRSLKGVGSSKLHGMVAVAPLMRMDKTDARFIESREIADHLNEGTNIAAIGWEDFEHLIREIFEKEFSREGAEVKVTRASRDGGVDAVVFDPDPLRGGKIVIQAKRYTNTVDVSAVRDLYGTVMNEGAIKGILVTTSAFGPDAYSFAKDKPLSLLDGGNLLHLLKRHGRQAYIDLAEAKKLNTDPLVRSKTEVQ